MGSKEIGLGIADRRDLEAIARLRRARGMSLFDAGTPCRLVRSCRAERSGRACPLEVRCSTPPRRLTSPSRRDMTNGDYIYTKMAIAFSLLISVNWEINA